MIRVHRFSSADLTAYSSPALFSDPGELDFGFDSGIEAEMDEPNGKIIHMLFTSWEVCIGKNKSSRQMVQFFPVTYLGL